MLRIILSLALAAGSITFTVTDADSGIYIQDDGRAGIVIDGNTVMSLEKCPKKGAMERAGDAIRVCASLTPTGKSLWWVSFERRTMNYVSPWTFNGGGAFYLDGSTHYDDSIAIPPNR